MPEMGLTVNCFSDRYFDTLYFGTLDGRISS